MLIKQIEELNEALDKGDPQGITRCLFYLYENLRIRVVRGDKYIVKLFVFVAETRQKIISDGHEQHALTLKKELEDYVNHILNQQLAIPPYQNTGMGRACYPGRNYRYRRGHLEAPPRAVPGSGDASAK